MITSEFKEQPYGLPIGTVVKFKPPHHSGDHVNQKFGGQRGVVINAHKTLGGAIEYNVWHPHVDWVKKCTIWSLKNLEPVDTKEVVKS